MNHDERGGTSMVTSVALHIYYSEFMMHNISCCCIYSLYIVYTVYIYIYTVYIYIYIYIQYIEKYAKHRKSVQKREGTEPTFLQTLETWSLLRNLKFTRKPGVNSGESPSLFVSINCQG